MWFLFGFITLISFSVYFGIQRLGTRWKGQIAYGRTVPYQYQFVRNKNDITKRFMVGVDAPPDYDFTFKREAWFDRLCKFLGLSVEHQVGHAEFDKLVYVVSNDGHFLDQISGNAQIIDAVVKLFALRRLDSRVSEVRCLNGRLWVTFKVGRLFSSDTDLRYLYGLQDQAAELLAQVVGQLKSNPPLYQDRRRDPFILRAAVILAVSTGLVANGLVHSLRLLWTTAEFTVDRAELWRLATYCGIAVMVLLVCLALVALGRSARTHLVLVELILVGTLGATLTAFSELRDLNMEWDHSAVQVFQPDILKKSVSRSRKGGTHYYAHVRDWNGGYDSHKVSVSRTFYDSVNAGDRLTVRQRAGYLGVRWVESYARSSDKHEGIQ